MGSPALWDLRLLGSPISRNLRLKGSPVWKNVLFCRISGFKGSPPWKGLLLIGTGRSVQRRRAQLCSPGTGSRSAPRLTVRTPHRLTSSTSPGKLEVSAAGYMSVPEPGNRTNPCMALHPRSGGAVPVCRGGGRRSGREGGGRCRTGGAGGSVGGERCPGSLPLL